MPAPAVARRIAPQSPVRPARRWAEPPIHVAAIKARGEWIPGVIDPAPLTSVRDGRQIIEEYRSLGLNLEPANNAVEAGINAVWTRLSVGRLKVFRSWDLGQAGVAACVTRTQKVRWPS